MTLDFKAKANCYTKYNQNEQKRKTYNASKHYSSVN